MRAIEVGRILIDDILASCTRSARDIMDHQLLTLLSVEYQQTFCLAAES
jgi:hypothetical protein